jgi:hypothetical protein
MLTKIKNYDRKLGQSKLYKQVDLTLNYLIIIGALAYFFGRCLV